MTGHIQVFTGHIQDGKVVFDAPIPLPEGTAVRVEQADTVRMQPASTSSPGKTLAERYASIIGSIDDPNLPNDGALNHDHYLYGTPKKQS